MIFTRTGARTRRRQFRRRAQSHQGEMAGQLRRTQAEPILPAGREPGAGADDGGHFSGLNCIRGNDFRAVELPYYATSVSMALMVPADPGGSAFRALERDLARRCSRDPTYSLCLAAPEAGDVRARHFHSPRRLIAASPRRRTHRSCGPGPQAGSSALRFLVHDDAEGRASRREADSAAARPNDIKPPASCRCTRTVADIKPLLQRTSPPETRHPGKGARQQRDHPAQAVAPRAGAGSGPWRGPESPPGPPR